LIPSPTPADLRAARRHLRMNRTEFAARLNTPLRTLNGWENEGREPPPCLAVALKYVVEHGEELP
jgi:DNA-binding transcriptional regulator YiaG